MEKHTSIEKSPEIDSSSVESTVPKRSLFWRMASPYDDPEERRFVMKLDLFLLTWACFSYCIKNIDQSNYKYAYISGMKEDLNMQGNSYNLLQTYFVIGYCVAVIPFQIILTKCRAGYFLAFCELSWGLCTCLCAIKRDSVTYLYPLRFFIGVFESVSWSGVVYVLFNYYNSQELSFRTGLLSVSTAVGKAFTGFMQAAIYTSLHEKHGVAGWRYMFIINGVMTMFVAVFGFFFVPDTVGNGGARWMTERDLEIATRRIEKVGRFTGHEFSFKAFVKVLTNKNFWTLLVAYCAWDLGSGPTGYITLWLSNILNDDGTTRYTVEQQNLIPGGGYLLAALSIVLITRYADVSGRRIACMVFQQLCGVFGTAVLTAWPSSLAFKFVAFFVLYTVQSTGAILMSFVPEIWAKEPDCRSVIAALIVVFDISFNAWLPLLVWRPDEAPSFKKGYPVSLGFQTLALVGCLVFYHLSYKRLQAKNQLQSQMDYNDS